MSTPMVFQFIFSDIVPALNSFIGEVSASMASVAGAAGGTMFAIYVLFWGIAILTGTVQEPMTDGFKRIVRGVAILAFATSAGIYHDWIVTFMQEVPAAIASEVVKSAGSGVSASVQGMGAADMLDNALGAGLSAAGDAWMQGDETSGIMTGVAFYAMSILIALFVGIVCAYAAVLVLMAQMGMSIMLGIGPIFIVLAMFEATQQLFVSWTRQVITFGVFFIILAAALTMTFGFFTAFLETLKGADTSQLVVTFTKLVVVSAVALGVLWQTTSWAAGLAGGIGVAGAGAVSRTIISPAQSAGAAMKGAVPRMARKEETKDENGNRTGTAWKGAIPSAVRGVAKGAAYMRRPNSIKRG